MDSLVDESVTCVWKCETEKGEAWGSGEGESGGVGEASVCSDSEVSVSEYVNESDVDVPAASHDTDPG